MKYLKLILIFVAINSAGIHTIVAQSLVKELEHLDKPYDPLANAQSDIDSLVALAKIQKKNIVIQAGGNWCIWCLRFNNFIHEDVAIGNFLDKHFLYYHLNYSKENKNEAVFSRYAPEGAKLGYPFFIVLDGTGKVIAVRESGSLESGDSYDRKKILSLFNEYKER
ncbi:thioredoxin family protein [Sphingobacterium sp. LRF_L2]|uniref:thioredoxin family protein n=1 Tax=Sphingobacterium sp. LRF_L2 TaxID=3369421 RepID=UPI003F62E282